MKTSNYREYKYGQVVDFEEQKLKAKSGVVEAIDALARMICKHKLTYPQLRYVYRQARVKAQLPVPKEPKRLIELPTAKELARFYKSIENPEHRLIFRFLENTGLRVSEMCSLQVQYIDLDRNQIFVRNGKGGKDRIVPIGNNLTEQVAIYLTGKNNSFLFESRRNKRYSTRRIEQLCIKYKQDAEITERLTPHTFRHIWNSRLAECGVSRELRELLAGHEKGSRTQDIYTHLGLEGFKSQIVKLLDSEMWASHSSAETTYSDKPEIIRPIESNFVIPE